MMMRPSRPRKRGGKNRRPRQNNPNFPATGSVLPMTPGYMGAQRGAEDQLASSLADIAYQRAQIPGQINMFGARQSTDTGYATDRLNEALVERGIYTSGIRPQLQMRDITIPAARQTQDFQLQMQQLANQLAMAEGEARLGYNQTMLEAMLGRAGEVAETMPLGLPGQFRGPRRQKNKKRRRGRR